LSRTVCGFLLDDGPILVTGAAGFAGRSLMEMFGLGPGDIAADAFEDFPVPAGVRKILWELPGSPHSALGEVRYIVHLAGLSSVAHSHADKDAVMEVNTAGTASVVEWTAARSPGARILLASSADVYLPSKGLLSEDSSIAPRSPYGQSKLMAEKVLENSGLDWTISRSFPHYGPCQQGHFVLPSFCRRIIHAVRNGEETITTGNLSAVRDYLYIEDVVRAYACLLARGRTGGVYNVCSGIGHSIGELLDMLMAISGTGLRAVTDPHLLRSEDQYSQIGDSSRLCGLGWKMNVSLEDGLGFLYKWWEERL
jgi:GDP-4-dehydro-6-deoxy-D-mannose reductase